MTITKRRYCLPSAPMELFSLIALRRVCGSCLPQLEFKMMKKPVTTKTTVTRWFPEVLGVLVLLGEE